MEEIVIQIIGWVGTFLIVLAYYLLSGDHITAKSSAYQIINLFGAIGVGINVWHQKAWPAVTLEIVWALIATGALSRLVYVKKQPPK